MTTAYWLNWSQSWPAAELAVFKSNFRRIVWFLGTVTLFTCAHLSSIHPAILLWKFATIYVVEIYPLSWIPYSVFEYSLLAVNKPFCFYGHAVKTDWSTASKSKKQRRKKKELKLFITYFAFTLFENLSINNLNFNYISLYLHHVVRYHTQF